MKINGLTVGRRRERTNASEREGWVRRYRCSGQSQRAFAEEHGLVLSTLRCWLRRDQGPERSPRWIELGVGAAQRPMEDWEAEVSFDGQQRRVRFRGGMARELLDWVKECLR